MDVGIPRAVARGGEESHMATTSAKDGAIDLEAFLDRLARDGESIVIERDGRPAAILAPCDDSATRRDPAPSGPTASEAHLKAIMDRSPVEIGLKDTAGRYVMVSRRFEELNGVTNDEVAGKTADDIFPEKIARVIAAHDAEILRTGEVSEREIEVTLDDGVHTYLTVKFPIVDAEGRVTGIGAISSDITERKRAQEALREAYDELEVRVATRTEELTEANRALRAREAQLRQAHQITKLGHWSWDPETDRLSVSPEMAAILGVAPKELEGITNQAYVERFIHPDDREQVWKFGNTRDANKGRFTIEYRLCHSGDTERWVQELGEAMVDEAGEPIGEVGTIQDITDRKRDESALRESEARLRQAQKMEAVGQLTGGVAHDFNNLLGVIMGNAEILADRVGETDPQLGAILRATRRGAELTNRLLAFSRRQALAPRSIDLDELVLGMTDLLARTLGETILVTASKTPGLWRAAADPGQLENALVNLAVNARDAMPGGGKLVIETVNMPLRDSAVAKRHGVSTGEYVSLLVTDNGRGMTPEVLARASDPFFTTKGVGQGSGLGLSMVEGFARQSGGFLTIESAPGAGATVKVVLPRAKEDSERPASGRKAREPKARGETILVVEDDPGVRDLAVSILKRLDYRVIESQDGRAALEILQKPDPIDLILTDVVLPGGLSGPDLVTKGKGWQPGIRVLFMSGYATDVLDDRDRSNAAGELLNKPFRRAELAERVRGALDRPDPV